MLVTNYVQYKVQWTVPTTVRLQSRWILLILCTQTWSTKKKFNFFFSLTKDKLLSQDFPFLSILRVRSSWPLKVYKLLENSIWLLYKKKDRYEILLSVVLSWFKRSMDWQDWFFWSSYCCQVRVVNWHNDFMISYLLYYMVTLHSAH